MTFFNQGDILLGGDILLDLTWLGRPWYLRGSLAERPFSVAWLRMRMRLLRSNALATALPICCRGMLARHGATSFIVRYHAS